MAEEKTVQEIMVEKIIEKYIESRICFANPQQLYSVSDLRSMLLMPKELEAVPCDSSNVLGYGYHEKSQTLKVLFQGNAEYRYLSVRPEEFQKLQEAESKGHVVHLIKCTHRFIKIK